MHAETGVGRVLDTLIANLRIGDRFERQISGERTGPPSRAVPVGWLTAASFVFPLSDLGADATGSPAVSAT